MCPIPFPGVLPNCDQCLNDFGFLEHAYCSGDVSLTHCTGREAWTEDKLSLEHATRLLVSVKEQTRAKSHHEIIAVKEGIV